MAGFKKVDTSGNEGVGKVFSKINGMLSELFNAGSEFVDWSGTSVTASGAVQGATLISTGLTTADTAKVGTGTKTAAATGGAATLNKAAGKITSEALTTAADAVYTLTLTNSAIAAADQVFASLANGTNTQGAPAIEKVTPAAGSVVITVRNNHASEALNGTLVVSFFSLKN